MAVVLVKEFYEAHHVDGEHGHVLLRILPTRGRRRLQASAAGGNGGYGQGADPGDFDEGGDAVGN